MAKKKIVEKVSNISTTNKEDPKNGTWIEYFCIFTGQKCAMNQEGANKLAIAVVNWAWTTQDAVKISEFYLSKGIARTTWWNLCEQFPNLKEAHVIAKEILGNRREKGWLKKEYDAGAVRSAMHHYDPDWMDIDQRHADLREKSAVEKSVVNVTMNAIPTSDKVPVRKVKESDEEIEKD